MSRLVRCAACGRPHRVEPVRHEIHGDPYELYWCRNVDCLHSKEAAICYRWWDKWLFGWAAVAVEIERDLSDSARVTGK